VATAAVGARAGFGNQDDGGSSGSTGSRTDGRDLRAQVQAAGYRDVWNTAGFNALTPASLPVLACSSAATWSRSSIVLRPVIQRDGGVSGGKITQSANADYGGCRNPSSPTPASTTLYFGELHWWRVVRFQLHEPAIVRGDDFRSHRQPAFAFTAFIQLHLNECQRIVNRPRLISRLPEADGAIGRDDDAVATVVASGGLRKVNVPTKTGRDSEVAHSRQIPDRVEDPLLVLSSLERLDQAPPLGFGGPPLDYDVEVGCNGSRS
jgi:hypothetical protein